MGPIFALPLTLLMGLLWAYHERLRRARCRATLPQQQNGEYRTGLFDCICNLGTCLPATLATSFLAAFNRADADGRECSYCDAVFSSYSPVAQFTTRQSIRSRYGLAEDPSDCLVACCCTPCGVAQDALELASRAQQKQYQEDQEELALREEEDALFKTARSTAQRRSLYTCVAD